MKRLAPSLALFFLASLGAFAVPDTAEAQCRRGYGPCVRGGFFVSPRRGFVRVGRPYYYPPPPTVIITAPPPPPPRYVVVQPPAPPPRQYVIVEPPQAEVVVPEPVESPMPPPAEEARETPPQDDDIGRVGLHGSIGGAFGESVTMGGIAGALRLRPSPHFAFDIGVGAYAGEDWHGNQRIEVPVNVDLLAFVNPQHRLQLYFVVGAGASAAFLQDESSWEEDYDRAFTYLGGTAGLGLEWRAFRHFALSADGRGFLRRRIDSDEPEFVDGARQTNTSAGLLLNLGATVYF
jgi:hypothetical protein